MKKTNLLLIAIPSIHFKRWITNIDLDKFNIYWFDILNKGRQYFKTDIIQITDWQSRKIAYIKGEYLLQQNFPFLFNSIETFIRITANEKLNEIVNKYSIDIIHSFEMQNCTYPFLNFIQKKKTFWIYSCWGSDLFYYQNLPKHNKKIRNVLKNIDYLITDNKRDQNLARNLGFKGRNLAIIPGGGGLCTEKYVNLIKPFKDRNTIIVKGYNHNFGRGLKVVKALKKLKLDESYKIVVFASHNIISNYVRDNKLNYTIYHRHELLHEEVLKLMGNSLIYIGNSISDGMPNTLLEALSMGAFPIQSNPGNVTAEIITDNKNGILIKDPECITHLEVLITNLLENKIVMANAFFENIILGEKILDKQANTKLINDAYEEVIKQSYL